MCRKRLENKWFSTRLVTELFKSKRQQSRCFLVLRNGHPARRKLDEQRLVRLRVVRGSHSTEAPFPNFGPGVLRALSSGRLQQQTVNGQVLKRILRLRVCRLGVCV